MHRFNWNAHKNPWFLDLWGGGVLLPSIIAIVVPAVLLVGFPLYRIGWDLQATRLRGGDLPRTDHEAGRAQRQGNRHWQGTKIRRDIAFEVWNWRKGCQRLLPDTGMVLTYILCLHNILFVHTLILRITRVRAMVQTHWSFNLIENVWLSV